VLVSERYYGSLDQLRARRHSRVLVQPADPGALVKTLQENGFTQVSPTPDGRAAVAGASVQQIGDLAAKSDLAAKTGIGSGAVLRNVTLAVLLLLMWFLIIENVLVIAT
jgi:hypothetical protein